MTLLIKNDLIDQMLPWERGHIGKPQIYMCDSVMCVRVEKERKILVTDLTIPCMKLNLLDNMMKS